ncbi:MAG: hypothetical protein V1929_02375 [bacterium]
MKAMPDMDLHGRAMLDYLNGDNDAKYILRRDDGVAYPPIYAKQFFYPKGLPDVDRTAVDHCAGRVLDIGAGAGSHSLAIQARGLDVTSADISHNEERFSPHAAGPTLVPPVHRRILAARGLKRSSFEWMHMDPETLGTHVQQAGWTMRTIMTEGNRFLISIKRP